MPALTQSGVKAIFTPGAPIEEAVKWVRERMSNPANDEMNADSRIKILKT